LYYIKLINVKFIEGLSKKEVAEWFEDLEFSKETRIFMLMSELLVAKKKKKLW